MKQCIGRDRPMVVTGVTAASDATGLWMRPVQPPLRTRPAYECDRCNRRFGRDRPMDATDPTAASDASAGWNGRIYRMQRSRLWGENDAKGGVGGGEVSVISCHILTHFDTFAAHFATSDGYFYPLVQANLYPPIGPQS